MKKEFIKWLKSKRLYSAVKRNHKNCKFTSEGDTLSENLDRYKTRYSLYLNLFAWVYTPEGDKFWIKVDKEWREHLKNL